MRRLSPPAPAEAQLALRQPPIGHHDRTHSVRYRPVDARPGDQAGETEQPHVPVFGREILGPVKIVDSSSSESGDSD